MSSIDTKPTNPKDVIGSTKLPLGCVPDTLAVFASLGFLEGALKYGRFNYRVAGVRASIYHDALLRHLAAWWNGEDCDRVTGVPHLASVLACAGIILDAKTCNKLTDDRPPSIPGFKDLVDNMTTDVKRLKELFKEHNPHQYVIGETSVKD